MLSEDIISLRFSISRQRPWVFMTTEIFPFFFFFGVGGGGVVGEGVLLLLKFELGEH